MQQIVSALLIPLVLVSQGLCTPHSHVGTSVVEPEGHSARLHVHFGSGTDDDVHYSHIEHDGHDEHPSHEDGPLDHDSDAFYVVDTQIVNDAKPAAISNAELSFVCWVFDESATIAGLRLCMNGGLPPPRRGLKCPLYLRILSIRC